MAGSTRTRAVADGPVDETPDLSKAHPLVGVAGPAPGVAETVTADPKTAEEQRSAIAAEYGQYVAVVPITHDGALAYNVGDPVPAHNVEQWGYLAAGLVRRTGAVEGSPATTPDHTDADPNA